MIISILVLEVGHFDNLLGSFENPTSVVGLEHLRNLAIGPLQLWKASFQSDD